MTWLKLVELTLSMPIVTVSCKSYLIRNTWKSSGVDNERRLDGSVRLNLRCPPSFGNHLHPRPDNHYHLFVGFPLALQEMCHIDKGDEDYGSLLSMK